MLQALTFRKVFAWIDGMLLVFVSGAALAAATIWSGAGPALPRAMVAREGADVAERSELAPRSAYDRISQAGLFGEAARPAAPPPADPWFCALPGPAAPSLVLKGVVACAPDDPRACAILQHSGPGGDGHTNAYFVGSKVTESLQLTTVMKDGVVLWDASAQRHYLISYPTR